MTYIWKVFLGYKLIALVVATEAAILNILENHPRAYAISAGQYDE